MTILKPGLSVGMCSDHAGYEMKEMLRGYLASQDIATVDFGTHNTESCDYADFAHPCAAAVESGKVYPGVALCGRGNGIAMTLNHHRGIRAAICWEPELARLARAHNDTNILVIPARFVKPETAVAILDMFLKTPFEGGRHAARIAKIVKSNSKCNN